MKHDGFTLVEVLLYTVIAASALATLFLIYTASLETNAYAEAQRRLLDVERPIELQIRSRLQEAPSVTTPASGSSSSLVVTSSTASESPTTFSVSGEQLMVQFGTDPAISMSPDSVRVTSFSATRSTGTPAAVLVTMTLSTSAPHATISRTFSFFVTLRYD
jgi:type II secretory pathway pseudopilin PulG